MEMEDTKFEPKMYFVISPDVKMDKGKIAAQVGHASVMLFHLSLIGLFPHSCKLPHGLSDNPRLQDALRKLKTVSVEDLRKLTQCFEHWNHHSYPKIVLKTSSEVFERLTPLCDIAVVDEGRTQITKGSTTVLGFLPRTRDMIVDSSIKELDALKLA
jgi:peptidyl-tRNA hydrolase